MGGWVHHILNYGHKLQIHNALAHICKFYGKNTHTHTQTHSHLHTHIKKRKQRLRISPKIEKVLPENLLSKCVLKLHQTIGLWTKPKHMNAANQFLTFLNISPLTCFNSRQLLIFLSFTHKCLCQSRFSPIQAPGSLYLLTFILLSLLRKSRPREWPEGGDILENPAVLRLSPSLRKVVRRVEVWRLPRRITRSCLLPASPLWPTHSQWSCSQSAQALRPAPAQLTSTFWRESCWERNLSCMTQVFLIFVRRLSVLEELPGLC